MKKIKQAEATAEFLAGKFVVVGEYRASSAETVNYRDKTTGRAASMESLRHTVETESGSFALDERVPDGAKASDVLASMKAAGLVKGSRVLVRLTSFLTQKGVTSARGTLELFDTVAK